MNQSSNQPQNQPKETTPNVNQSPPPSTTNEDLLKNLLAAMGPVVDFHKTVVNASENDLRLFWDIRLVQGKETPFTSMSGHSSFPGVLVGSALGQLPSVMSREIVEKIAVPMAARLQDMTNDRALGLVMKNVQPASKPPKLNKKFLEDRISAESLVPQDERNEIIDVMLPKEMVEEAAEIISEMRKYE